MHKLSSPVRNDMVEAISCTSLGITSDRKTPLCQRNLLAHDRIEIKKEGSVIGKLQTVRIVIEEGGIL